MLSRARQSSAAQSCAKRWPLFGSSDLCTLTWRLYSPTRAALWNGCYAKMPILAMVLSTRPLKSHCPSRGIPGGAQYELLARFRNLIAPRTH